MFLLAALGLGPAVAGETLRMAVLASRPADQTEQQWAPVARYLEAALPGRKFSVTAYDFAGLDRAVAGHEVDLVLTNPEHYIQLSASHELAVMATRVARAGDVALPHFGGAIVVRAERQDLATLADLRAKTLAAPGPQSLGGYLAQAWALRQAGLVLPDDVESLRFTGMPHDQAVFAVLDGTADAGFIRTGVLEALIAEGKVAASRLRVLNPQTPAGFPYALSTALYPEWALARMPRVPDAVAREIAVALFALRADHPAARSAGIDGFIPPGNYRHIDELRLRLRMHPNRLEFFGLAEIARKYAAWLIVVGGLLLMAALAATVVLARRGRQLAAALAEARRLGLREDLLESLGEGVYGIDEHGNGTFINRAALAMLGYEREDIVGRDPHAIFHHHRPDGSPYPREQCPIHASLRDGRRRESEETFFRRDGSPLRVRMLATPIRDGGADRGAVVAFQDIEAQKEAEEKIRRLALHDMLTGLPNRRLLRERLIQTMAQARRNGKRVGVLFLDLDGFKPINDRFGHEAGDTVLVEVAHRLGIDRRATDTVARFAGDEFVVLLADLDEVADAGKVAGEIVARIGEPIRVRKEPWQVTCSIGIAIFPDHGDTLDRLLHEADAAMYLAKHGGKNGWRLAAGSESSPERAEASATLA